MAQALSQPGGVPPPPLAPSPIPPTPSRGDELPTNNLNSYVRAKLSKGEVINYSDCARALGTCQLAWSDQPASVISLQNIRSPPPAVTVALDILSYPYQ